MPKRVRRAQLLWQGPTGQTYTLTLDATVRESHVGESTVTDHPVERGSNVADHIRPDPDTLTMDAQISNTPHFLPVDHMGAVQWPVEKEIKGAVVTVGEAVRQVPLAGGAIGIVGSFAPIPTTLIGQIGSGQVQTAIVQGFSAEFDRVTECYQELLRIRREGQLLRILTTLREYADMALTHLEVTREASSGNALVLNLAFKNVRFGTTKNEPVPKIPVESKPKGTAVKEEHKENDGDNTSALRLWLNKGR